MPSARLAALPATALAALVPLAALATSLLPNALRAQQVPDSSFHATVAHPAYASDGPTVRLDEAHHNFHTIAGRYAPFAELLRHDGYHVEPNRARFTDASLRGAAVLVIANALGGDGMQARDAARPAFTPQEVAAVRRWVEHGGSLLLIADHAPFGAAAEEMGRAFGVAMGKGFARDTAPGTAVGNPTLLRFSRDNGLLGDHAITRGRDTTERITTVLAFTGQSLSVPGGATPLLRLSPTAEERPTRADMFADPNDATRFTSAAGRAQGLAMTVGRGRVVVLGEAAMFSAQIIRRPQAPPILMGMNVPGSDDQQFCLNVLHWLSHALE
jgi:hypothetical protein